jgi:hypothetical protein
MQGVYSDCGSCSCSSGRFVALRFLVGVRRVAAKRVDDFVFVVSAREIPTPCRWQLKFTYGHRESSGLRDALSYTNFGCAQPLATLHIPPKHLNLDETGDELRMEIARAVSRRNCDA